MDEEAKQLAIQLAMKIAPDSIARNGFIKMVTTMERGGETKKSIVKTLIGTMYDGLAYGNWPWGK
jgi:hypothetical protein